MKILVPVDSAALAGSQLALLRLMESCPSNSVSFSCWLFDRGPLARELDRRGIPWEFYPRHWLRTPWGLSRLQSRLRDERPDAIYLHASRLIACLARVADIPCLERVNMPRAPGAGGWCRFPLLDRLFTNLNTRTLAVSGSLRHQLVRRGVQPEKVVVFRDLIYPERFKQPQLRAAAREELRIPPEARVVLNIGRMIPQKAQDDFLQLATRSCDAPSDTRFLLVGEGPLLRSLQTEAARLQLGHRLQILPFREDVAALYALSDIYVQTSRWEGLANVVLEAMAAGLSVVATDVDGTREALAGYPRHRLVAPGDIAAMTQALREWIRQPAEPMRAPFPSQFTREEVCRHFLGILAEVVGAQ